VTVPIILRLIANIWLEKEGPKTAPQPARYAIKRRNIMGQAINESDLLAACCDIARATSWKHKDSQSTSLDSIATKAERYKQIALSHVEWLVENQINPNELVAAVQYLGIHAIPPMGDDEQWFADMLDVIVQLFAPNVGFEKDDDITQFLGRLRDAINRTIENAE